MAASDLLKTNFDFMASGPLGETIEYKSIGGLPEALAPWETVPAIVDLRPDLPGTVVDRGHVAAVVGVSKTYLAACNPDSDMVRIRGKEYVVSEIVSEDTGAWTLYCVR